MCFACTCVCALCMCLVPMDTRRGCQVPPNWNTGSCEPCGCCEPKPVLMQDRECSLATDKLPSNKDDPQDPPQTSESEAAWAPELFYFK